MPFRFNERQDFLNYFVSEVISSSALENAIDWIKEKLEPEDVFDKDQLENWAEQNGYIKE